MTFLQKLLELTKADFIVTFGHTLHGIVIRTSYRGYAVQTIVDVDKDEETTTNNLYETLSKIQERMIAFIADKENEARQTGVYDG